jgi:glucose-1-phosphate adenylyltransferase
VFQNIDIIEDLAPRHIVLLAGDHVYKMDYEVMLQQHLDRRAGVTVCCMTVPRADASAFGVVHVDEHDRIVDFVEKPADPPSLPGQPDQSFASMGIYVFETKVLIAELRRDAADPASAHDFGKDIIPHMVAAGQAAAHRFEASCVRSAAETMPYWRDVGTIDAYWEASIDLTDVVPPLDIFDKDWPIWTYAEVVPPAKFVHDLDGRRGEAVSSLVSGGCIVSGASAKHSLLFTGVRLHSYAMIDGAVLLPQVDVGRRARLTNVVVDRGVHIPEGLVVGEDPVADAARFRRSEKGICLITQAMLDRIAA